MASPISSPQQIPLAERADVHRSCKSLEAVANALNDYSEAAVAIVTLQKKVMKALKETAGLKITGEIASNALNTSATIFETLADIDSKFTKFLVKECEELATEVRKWVKKLNKEEKLLDEHLASANARIKHAGQQFEKKSKKSPRDAGEEHARYINLISTLGPEISQTKHQHAVVVTQRHATTTYCVAACVSRMVDAEWLRSCEGVKRLGSSVGALGQWKALCEAGWVGDVPRDLPTESETSRDSEGDTEVKSARWDNGREMPPARPIPEPLHVGSPHMRDSPRELGMTSDPSLPSFAPTDDGGEAALAEATAWLARPISQSPQQRHKPQSTPPVALSSTPRQLPRSPDNEDNFGSLSAFPAPPTHLPTPPANFTARHRPRLSSLTQLHAPPSQTDYSAPPPNAPPARTSISSLTSQSLQESPVDQAGFDSSSGLTSLHEPEHKPGRSDTLSSQYPSQDPRRVAGNVDMPDPSFATTDTSPDQREFGVRRNADARMQGNPPGARLPKASTVNDSARSSLAQSTVERSDSLATNTTNGSKVAAMRSRYSYPIEMPTSPRKEVPRLPLSVTDLATRYEPVDVELERVHPLSPRRRTASPPFERQLAPLETGAFARTLTVSPSPTSSRERRSAEHERPPEPATARAARDASPAHENASRAAPQRPTDDQPPASWKEMERTLRARERALEERAKDLERERANLFSAHGLAYDNDLDHQSPHPYQQQAQQQVDFPSTPRPPPRHSYSTTHLVPPPPTGQDQASRSQPPSPNRHASFCGCDACSVSKYKAKPTTAAPVTPLPEKATTTKSGWMRRLSMPVSVGKNAFSLDSAKRAVARVGAAQEDGRMRASLDRGNRSYTNLRRL